MKDSSNAPLEAHEFCRERGDGRTPGIVYVFCSADTGLFKIGRTNNLERRLAEVGRREKSPVYCVFSIPDEHTSEIEARIHRSFRFTRVRGEWFRLDEEEVGDLCSLLAGGEV